MFIKPNSKQFTPNLGPYLLYKMKIPLLISVLTTIITQSVFALKEDNCPVCFSMVDKLKNQLAEKGEKITVESVTNRFLDMCKTAKKGTSDDKFCYYMGGHEVSATRTYKELAEKMTTGLPVDKICERLNQRDSQICEIREKKPIDLKTVDLKKLKVADLRRLLKERGVACEGCFEKAEFIKKAEELKAQEAAREEL